MKLIAITGKNGYLSNNLADFLNKNGRKAELVSVRNEISEDIFKKADVVVHMAGIVHKKASAEEYENVNFLLTKRLAQLAKKNGVGHFVFVSTMSVYGRITGEIDENTPLEPVNGYGKSKLMAEQAVLELADEKFCVSIVRPPMVYGKNCTGNYAALSALVKNIPVFPRVNNKRSMIFVDNLSACIKKIIDEKITGVILPQNAEYVNTSDMCAYIAKYNNNSLHFSKMLGLLTNIFCIKPVKKAFGSLYYSKNVAFSNDVVDFEETIRLTET